MSQSGPLWWPKPSVILSYGVAVLSVAVALIKEIPRLLIFALALVSSGVVAQTAVETPRTIRVVMDNAYAPYSFQSDEGKLQGILIDQWQTWEKKTGIKVEIHAMDWGEALGRMRAGEFDVIDSIVETAERRDYFDFTPAYSTIEASIYFRNDISGITDLASLKGFPVGVKTGDQHIDTLKENGVTTVILFQNNEAIIEAAKQHKINVFVVDDPSALYLLNKIGLEAEFRHSAPIFRDELRRAVRKGDAATLRTVSEGFAAIEPGELKQIDVKWFGSPINRYEHYLTYAGYAVVVAMLLIAGLVGWNRMLRKRILQRTAALGESEQRFRQIAENIHEVFWLTTTDSSKTLYISPAYEAVWGRSCESLYQDPHSFIAAIHPEDDARVTELLGRDRDRDFEIEYRVVRPDGSIRWIWDRAFPIKDESGRFYRIAGIAEDITERKHAEDALRRSEDRIRLIIDTIPIMAWSVRPDGAVDFVNQRSLDYTGLSLEEEIEGPTSIIHPEDLPGVMENWLANMAAGEPSEDEMRLRRADGEYRWFLVRTAPLRDEQGNLVKWYGISIDIEDRKRAEEKLKQSESQLAEAQRLAHVGSWDYDLATNSVTWSDELYRIFGIQPGKMKVAGDAMPFIHPEDRDLVFHTVTSSIKSKEPYSFYYRVLRTDGDERIVHSRGFIVSDENGNPIRVVGATQDVTELKRAEEKLKATSEQLRALSARLQSAREEEGNRIAREIHDELGGALTSLKWDLESFDKAISESRDQAQLQVLQEKLESMMKLIDSIISAVRRISSELRPSVLDDLGLAEAIEWQARQFQTRTGIICHCDCAVENLHLNQEQSTAVFRIFQEALTNILRHAQATRVEVAIREEAGEFVLTVSDNGRGITKDDRARLQSLGLLGMRERAHLVGGEIELTGVEGRGTVVTVRVPNSKLAMTTDSPK
ncbi:MAG TPA: PAS domain-containing protein [Pyrinomonadaceae bacterium]|jgi:PAS domain S-box-containing protein